MAASIQDILEQARKLGGLLAENDRVRTFVEANKALAGNDQARKLMEDYEAQVHHVHQLEAERKPIEVADKHKLRDLEGAMVSNELVQKMIRAQADYVDLMRKVNQAIDGHLHGIYEHIERDSPK